MPQIQKYVPSAKLIAVPRNPIERAYSDYLMHVRDLVDNQKPLAEQVRADGKSLYTLLKGFYMLKGLYSEGLANFIETFGPNQVKVFLYDELQADSDRFMQTLYRFIGVDYTFQR